MKKGLILGMLLMFSFCVSAQNSNINIWKTLADVDYEITKDEYGDLYVPVFGEDIKQLEGKEVIVDGFIIPFEGMFKPKELILSSLPISECFFCGSGGPETVMEVYMKEEMKYRAARVKIKGILTLNSKNPDKLMYILKDSEYVGLATGAY